MLLKGMALVLYVSIMLLEISFLTLSMDVGLLTQYLVRWGDLVVLFLKRYDTQI